MTLLIGAALLLASAPAAPVAADAAAPVPLATLLAPVLNVADPDAEIAFYVKVFGMALAQTLDAGSKREYMLRFSADPRAPGLILMAPADPAHRVPLVHGDAFSRLVLRTTDIEGIAARLDAGGWAHEPIRDVAHGYRMLMLRTPAGYRIEVVQSGRNS